MREITIRQLLTHTGGTGATGGNFREISKPKEFIEATKNKDPIGPWRMQLYHSTGFMTGEGWFGHTGHYDGANGELRIYSEYTVSVLANRDQDQASNLAEFIHDELKKIG